MGRSAAAGWPGGEEGLTQAKLKTVLAYSTVSQMGLLATALAVALAPRSERGTPLIALQLIHFARADTAVGGHQESQQRRSSVAG